MDLKYIGENIRNRRKELGLTIVDVQQATGISNGNLSGIENGKSAPSAQAIIALSKVLQCTTDYLLLDNQSCEIPKSKHPLSDNETILLEYFNSLDISGQLELLDYAQFKMFQNFKNSKDNLSNKEKSNKIQERYSSLDQRNNGNIIA